MNDEAEAEAEEADDLSSKLTFSEGGVRYKEDHKDEYVHDVANEFGVSEDGVELTVTGAGAT